MEKLPDIENEELVEQKLDGVSYTQIRSQLEEKGLSREEIKSVIREVDDRVLRAEIEGGARDRAKSWYRIGLSLAIVGLVLTIGANAGWILKTTPRWIIYAPFFIGILLMYYGRRLQQKQADPFEKGPGRIRKRRPYK